MPRRSQERADRRGGPQILHPLGYRCLGYYPRGCISTRSPAEIRQGGSTITQQLARELFLTRERTYTRVKSAKRSSPGRSSAHTPKTKSSSAISTRFISAAAPGESARPRAPISTRVSSDLDLAQCALTGRTAQRTQPLQPAQSALITPGNAATGVLTCMAETGSITQAVADSVSKLPVNVNPVKPPELEGSLFCRLTMSAASCWANTPRKSFITGACKSIRSLDPAMQKLRRASTSKNTYRGC